MSSQIGVLHLFTFDFGLDSTRISKQNKTKITTVKNSYVNSQYKRDLNI